MNKNSEDACSCLITCILIPGMFLLIAAVSYMCGFDEIVPERYSEIDQMVQETPELKPIVDKAMKDGHINMHEYNKIMDSRGWIAKRKYQQ